MNVLALETATEACSVALSWNGEVKERLERSPRQHAALLLPWVDELLAEAGTALNRLDGIAFGCGPGSFTSLRIGIGVVQGLALGANLGVRPVSSLLALAEAALSGDADDGVIVATDARMGEVFTARFIRQDSRLEPQDIERAIAPEEIPVPDGQRWLGAGNGFATYRTELQQRLGTTLSDIRDDAWPTAAAVIRIAERQPGTWLAPEAALPNYIRNQVAQRPASAR